MKKWFPIALLVAPLLFLALDAYARPGGGHSYSGGGGGYSSGGGGYSSGGGGYSSGGGGYSSGGSSYDSSGGGSGGSGSGGGELIYLLLRLIFEAPVIGVPLTIAIIAGLVWFKMETSMESRIEWNSAPYIPPPPPDLTAIRRLDPEFSSVLFEDFLYHLYAEAHRARRDPGELAALAPQFSQKARTALAARQPAGVAVERVVVGAMTVSSLTLPDKAKTADGQPYYIKIALRFESNMRCGSGDTAQSYYVDETWMIARAADVSSVPPERMRVSLCANCGAPYDHSSERTCSSCDQIVDDGRFGWLVTNLIVNRQETRPQSLTGYAPEVGTHDRTLVHPRTRQELGALAEDDAAFSVEDLILRARLIFAELYQAWNDDDIARARPYVSDNLFNYLRYWLDAYRHEGLENWVEDHSLTNFLVAKVVRDRHYDAITIRIWAQGKDYTVDSSGKLVGGSKSQDRQFSEYWTFIRSAQRRGATLTEKKCPNCGAEQRISMAGVCEFCQAHISSGEFDWILSKIEQDESYRG